ncbi:flagellar hook-basal body complex protein FliE [Pseudoalteromonas tunicata]|jgi:flagellar hook-basal body complex protein FliE|uniref:Flagellar hook-basal body complex protein FliE n=1 Tax=Pseudoalteromonas tunicata D2 TaxID=87626 RepID=A4C6D5_9GAMM|nr:flagellar hook-basal body complex protein FliE [Pseudoalteromonas tunicata]ATC95514.1 flagellar hook-basal body complex protein FliE [Pseudoalteromonas tunicata]AXT31088.1 flagellar hook-basal body complex protein FliE [Pseudoalteromonas tunicata]EAR29539.1 flagellar biosynthesis; basal-body component [Pseudoalteromonas tunicata D2]MDP4982531.1 flagellar hook-basal body complex protein FliE [Pseudoalteromonas tunicata]MDP5212443.1 flagellar hook-basal body complex protein FliE [Pseudoaltero
MNISGNSLLQEMQSIAMEAGQNVSNRLPTAPSSSADFSSLLRNAIDTVSELQQDAKTKVTAVEMGDRRVSLAEAMIASEKSSVAFEATVQVRNKLVEAYKDIMNMPV